jgi:hypothetical protein
MPALPDNKVKVTYTVGTVKNTAKNANRLKMLTSASEEIVAIFLPSKNFR